MPDGEKGAFETVLVILAPTSQKADPTQVIKQVVEIRTVVDKNKVVFKESPRKPDRKPNLEIICAKNPADKRCPKPGPDGKCPPGWGRNEDGQCFPRKCPSGHERIDDDESGTCFPKYQIKICPDGYKTHVRDKCPKPLPTPTPTPSIVPRPEGVTGSNVTPPTPEITPTPRPIAELPLTPTPTPEGIEPDIPSALFCQPQDDFCEPGCESESMDCINDLNGDDGVDSVPPPIPEIEESEEEQEQEQQEEEEFVVSDNDNDENGDEDEDENGEESDEGGEEEASNDEGDSDE
jgi:hypothetical protein